MDRYHADGCGGTGAGCDGCGYVGLDGLWYAGPSPTGTTLDTSGDYPIIVSIPDGPWFAREVDPDEGYSLPWVVIHYGTGEHAGNLLMEPAARLVAALNRTV